MRHIDREDPCMLQDVDGTNSAATTPGDIMVMLETPTTPLPLHSPHTITTTDSMPPSTPPPSYDEVLSLNVPPPTYESVFGRVREVHRTSSGIVDFVKNLIILLLGTIGCTVMLGVTIIIPIVMIVIGSLKMNDCPAEEYIPIYLVVGGTFGVIKSLLSLEVRRRAREDEVDASNASVPWHRRLQFGGSISVFLFVWFIFGCVWVYRIYEPSYDNSSTHYCDYTLYQFTFWLLTSVYICMGLLMSCMCCLSVATVVMQHSQINSAHV
ncbi:transmembrane protein 272-like isoform X1 [Macrobrachium rosenbergii]|uniref:transmembrane protein 272-like isoform X1 n=1 Tax=Macrobrachium rosenbergii TaxID=79674 RepID=UPI0034D50BCD